MPRRLNVLVWIGVVAVVVFLWLFGVRTRLHLVDETRFIVLIGVAALALTGLFWWGIRSSDEPPEPLPPNKET